MFPLAPFSNRLSEDVPSDDGPLRLPRYLETSEFAIHGFAWQLAWDIAQHDAALIELVLDDHTSPWPSRYRAVQQFSLSEGGLEAKLIVTNTGSSPMPAGIGFHPYLPKGDCEAVMNIASKWEQDADGLPLREVPSEWSEGTALKMDKLRVDHSYSGWDGTAQLLWPSQNLKVTMETDERLRELVIYSPDDDYFCIEPVSHVTNAMFAGSLSARRGWCILESGGSIEGSMRLRAEHLS